MLECCTYRLLCGQLELCSHAQQPHHQSVIPKDGSNKWHILLYIFSVYLFFFQYSFKNVILAQMQKAFVLMITLIRCSSRTVTNSHRKNSTHFFFTNEHFISLWVSACFNIKHTSSVLLPASSTLSAFQYLLPAGWELNPFSVYR